MSGLLIAVLLALTVLGAMWLAGLRGPLLMLAGAALAFGGAGYALQGRPDLPGDPRQSARAGETVDLSELRTTLMGSFTGSERWLNLADSYARRGKSEEAVRLLSAQVRRHPRDYALWVGLGNALVEHGGSVSPAARLAFERADALAPNHPAPRFFLGLAEARSGNPVEASRQWKELLASAPADAGWRPMVEQALVAIGQAPTGS